jgi:hypothetical protein
MRIPRITQDKLWRLLLRWIPLIPAPEIYGLVRDVKRSQDDVDEQVTEASLRFYQHHCSDAGGLVILARFPIGHPDASV